jgi:hypothetical protein
MSINVEMIGKTLMVEHYVAEVATPALRRMVSVSDAFTPNGYTRGSGSGRSAPKRSTNTPANIQIALSLIPPRNS